jgi:Ala-tRNA(Pro) deacylase
MSARGGSTGELRFSRHTGNASILAAAIRPKETYLIARRAIRASTDGTEPPCRDASCVDTKEISMLSQETSKAGSLPEQALLHVLAQSGLGYELIQHPHTETASAEAHALGVTPEEVAKTVILRTADGYARVVVPASERVALSKVRTLLDLDTDTRLATEAELAAAYPEFELGAVPPLGGPAGDTIIVDRRLAERERLVFEAGSHDESVRVATEDLLRVSEARIGDVCVD